MAALTGPANVTRLGGTGAKLSIPAVAGGDTFYEGGLCYGDATAGLVQAVPGNGDVFLGICAKTIVAAASDLVEVYVDGIFLLAFTGAAVGDVGDWICIDQDGTLSDNPTDLVASGDITVADNDIPIGKCLAISGSAGWVKLMPGLLFTAVGIDEAFTLVS